MNNKDKLFLKDDICFLEYPTWLVSEKNTFKTFTIEKENGKYTISTTDNVDRLPDRNDKIVLYYLLHELFSNMKLSSSKIITTRYKIAKNIIDNKKNICKASYERIMLSLERWTGIFIKFEGVFYNGGGYTNRYFHIIDNVFLNKKTKELSIKFNEEYIKQLRETNYFKLIDFDEYKRLRRPVSARLYEILIKTFKDRDTWQIGIIKLAEKLTLEKREGKENYYPSDVIIKLIPAVNEINKRTGLKIHLHYNKETHVCTFTKVKQSDSPRSQDKTQQVSLPFEDDRFVALTELLPKEHEGKKTILDALNRTYQKHGFDYVARNIRYTNRYCKGNYRAYLTKALKEDWGVALEEDDKRKEKVRKEQERKHHEEQEDIKNRTELNRRAREEIEKLSSEEIEALREEALSQLDSTTRKNAEKLNFIETLIRSGMEEIIRDRLRDEDKDR
jgi:hypothetical protein